MQMTMEEIAGIYRTGATLASGVDRLARIQGQAKRLQIEDRSRTFNTELTSALELGYMIDLAEVIIHLAEARTESRGAHQRTDYPERDDQRFLSHSLAYRTLRWSTAYRVLAGNHHQMASWRTSLRQVMTWRIRLRWMLRGIIRKKTPNLPFSPTRCRTELIGYYSMP